MPTEETNSSTEETSGQEQQNQQQGTTDETSGNGDPQPVVIDDNTKLPDTHPLVKSVATLRAEIATQKTELAEARAKAKQVTALEQERDARPTTEAMETLQTRYDRLESFLQAVGGPLSRALDSRTFTKDLFESDKDIAGLVKDFLKANPTATSAALASTAGAPAAGKKNPNDLLRAAIGR